LAVKSSEEHLIDLGMNAEIASILADGSNPKNVQQLTYEEFVALIRPKIGSSQDEWDSHWSLLHPDFCYSCKQPLQKDAIYEECPGAECDVPYPSIVAVQDAPQKFDALSYTTIGTNQRPIVIEYTELVEGQEDIIAKRDDREMEFVKEFFIGSKWNADLIETLDVLSKAKPGDEKERSMIEVMHKMQSFKGTEWLFESSDALDDLPDDLGEDIDESEKIGEESEESAGSGDLEKEKPEPESKDPKPAASGPERSKPYNARRALIRKRKKMQQDILRKTAPPTTFPISIEFPEFVANDLHWRFGHTGDIDTDVLSKNIKDEIEKRMNENPSLFHYATVSEEYKKVIHELAKHGIFTENDFITKYLETDLEVFSPDQTDERKIISEVHLLIENELFSSQIRNSGASNLGEFLAAFNEDEDSPLVIIQEQIEEWNAIITDNERSEFFIEELRESIQHICELTGLESPISNDSEES